MTHDELNALLDGVTTTLTAPWLIPRAMPRVDPSVFTGQAVDWSAKIMPPRGSLEQARAGLERELRFVSDKLKSQSQRRRS